MKIQLGALALLTLLPLLRTASAAQNTDCANPQLTNAVNGMDALMNYYRGQQKIQWDTVTSLESVAHDSHMHQAASAAFGTVGVAALTLATFGTLGAGGGIAVFGSDGGYSGIVLAGSGLLGAATGANSQDPLTKSNNAKIVPDISKLGGLDPLVVADSLNKFTANFQSQVGSRSKQISDVTDTLRKQYKSGWFNSSRSAYVQVFLDEAQHKKDLYTNATSELGPFLDYAKRACDESIRRSHPNSAQPNAKPQSAQSPAHGT